MPSARARARVNERLSLTRAWANELQRPVDPRRIVGVVLLIVLAVIAVATAAASVRHAETANRQTGASSSAAAAVPPRIVVISDGSFLRKGGSASQQWTADVGKDLGVVLTLRADPGHGYLAEGSDSFTALAAGIPADTRVVVFAGGVGKKAAALQLASAATAAYSAARTAAPGTKVLIVSRPTSTVPDSATNTVLRSSAALAKADWASPGGWFRADGDVADGALTAAGVTRARTGFESLIAPLLD